MFCGNNGWGGNSALWIIILIIILFGWGGSGNGCGCNSCGNGCNGFGAYGNNLGNAAYGFVGDWVNIVVTLTVLQSILGLVCNWNCGCGCGATTYNN